MGKVINLFPVRSFTRNGKEGKVVNMVIADETSNIRVVLWDMNHIQLIENGQVGLGSVIEITNGSMRDNEVHLGSFSEMKKTNAEIENARTERVVKEETIAEFKVSESAKTRAFIVQVFEPRFFNVCPECKKKATSEGENFICQEHGKVIPEKRSLLNIVIDDGTETIRSVIFHDNIEKLGIKVEGDFSGQKNSLLGREMFFSGNIRTNKVFNNPEFVIDQIEEPDLNKLIEILEK